MHFQFDVTPVTPLPTTEPPPATVAEGVDLLRQILSVQKEQLEALRASAAAHDMGGRWKAFLSRWHEEFPDLAIACRKALPAIERAYGKLMTDLTETVCQDGDDALETDFALQEFLDRYGMRLAQLGTILNLVGPLAEAGSQGESQGEAT
jgi:hypothetical protein